MEAALEHQLTPDELAFREHVCGALFQAGVDAGRWRLLSVDWPAATLAISAAARPGSPDEFFFRFELTGYPSIATACPIDSATGQTLSAEMRPKGELRRLGLPARLARRPGSLRPVGSPVDRRPSGLAD